MKTLLIITHIDFWRQGAGHRSRLSALIQFVKDRFATTVVYAGTFSEEDAVKIDLQFPGISVVALEPDRTISFKEHGGLFQSFIAGKKFDIVLIEYIEMAFALPMIDFEALTILDTHDLVADRIQSFHDNGIFYHGIWMSEEEELGIFNCFDKVLLITEEDHRKIGNQIGFDRALLVPHAPVVHKRPVRKRVENIGFVGSEYIPNSEGIRWFLDKVWPQIDNATLNVYGNVCTRLTDDIKRRSQNVVFHGFVKDLDEVYDHCDIIINPVTAGAGLKIKNIEAMANARPLITTNHGASGISEGCNDCFIVANTSKEFISELNRLIQSRDLRNDLASKAYAFVERNFSSEACYGELTELMLQPHLTE